jgi:hypothetical protein
MYTAVPQEADGTVQNAVVRYILHRFFAQRGWFIRGLEPGSGAKNNATGANSLEGLQEWVPSFLQNFLEQLAGGRGISLRELAILAATLEDLVHKETSSRLDQAFHALEHPHESDLNQEQISEVLEVFMMIYMVGGKFTAENPEAVRRAHNVFAQKVKDWAEVQEWMQGVLKKIHPTADSLDFNAIEKVAEEIGATYAVYNKKECASLKTALLDVEAQKAGRVRLPDFYSKGLSGVFDFNEKIDYLRVLGALDESDPKQPHVIVPNYVSARPNCLAASNFYAICCSNECEDLMAKLENAIASELATPEQIFQLVSAISSDTVSAPRTLSATITGRLHSIAKSNGGQVPLHGRLFAQWMHHAFPRECPFPHEDGSTNPQTPDEWMQASGQASGHTEEELKAHVDSDTEQKPKGAEARSQHHFEENELQWSESEELLLPFGGTHHSQPRGPLRSIGVFMLLGAMAYTLMKASEKMASGIYEESHRCTKLGFECQDLGKDAGKMA